MAVICVAALVSPPLSTRAQQPEPDGMGRDLFLRGLAFEFGEGGPAAPASAARAYEAAAARNVVPAMLRLAHLYQTGTGVPRDPAKAFAMISRAAESDFEAKFQLALMYLDGTGTARDAPAARSWLARAGRDGHQRAQLLLGLLLREGIGGEPNKYAASQWLDRATFGNAEVAALARRARDEVDSTIRASAAGLTGEALIAAVVGFAVAGAIVAQASGASPRYDSARYDQERLRKKFQCESQCWAGASGSNWITTSTMCRARLQC